MPTVQYEDVWAVYRCTVGVVASCVTLLVSRGGRCDAGHVTYRRHDGHPVPQGTVVISQSEGQRVRMDRVRMDQVRMEERVRCRTGEGAGEVQNG